MRYLLIISLSTFMAFSCSPGQKQLSEQEKQALDSISRAEQSRRADSMKKRNPLLIIPPDSTYTGSYVDRYPNGIVKFRGYFRFGQRHGQWMSFYPNGLMWSEMYYDKGLREGPNVTYFESGKKRYEGFYKNDLRDSIWVYYDSTGTAAKRVLFKNDKVVQYLPLEEKKARKK
jgi:antitoxin component YwqK of YwqJK toxin-antitoxin module